MRLKKQVFHKRTANHKGTAFSDFSGALMEDLLYSDVWGFHELFVFFSN